MTEARLTPPEAPVNCPLCPRLVAYRKENDEKHPDWFNGAVPSFGDETAKLLVIGLAPGVTGANKTGRPFTGDWAGDLLYATLQKFGFSEGTYQGHPDDGLRLKRAMITNAVRCVPPANKPVGAEINECRPFLVSRIKALPRLKVLLCLGKIAHDSTVRGLGLKLKDHPFGHGSEYTVQDGLTLLSSYHCSRYNTNTGRLTPEMFETVFARAKDIIA
ncbi:MAG: uracil-DNA glycosylase [Henriciella sp.]|uniref:uracil-DNA glycosylase n=1 Tax=Henriciella sp. TaxID=1968823 RepID=UPI0032EC262C